MTEKMTIYEHIDELRKRIIIVVAFFLIAMVAGLFIAQPIIVFLQGAPEAQSIPMNAFKLTDPIKVYMQFAFLMAVIVTSPVALYQLWAFISPGLYENERKVTLGYIPLSVILFISGLLFAYFVLFPFIIRFISGLAEKLNITEQYGINEYFSFLFQLTIPFGILFQLPVVVMFLTRLGILTPMFLASVRKYAYFVLLVIAGFITPPELLSHMMVTVPMLLLYEISIVISRFSYKKVLRAQMKVEND
ncbi:twin-arginine translocase subunit TatC [Bacillus taeanensis]|uniref:Sec-independent protein translocase protein TatC n=1 Tax=Bacillus taeanensis TaxID=273032 RepID=A0A366XPA3_9BACI|nr:twin-arginine translocase subunit TatC [Bacillus taeanensis]RBW67566.1 twin-arginine translocase subunit TatC [Bacillus taeanensis]